MELRLPGRAITLIQCLFFTCVNCLPRALAAYHSAYGSSWGGHNREQLLRLGACGCHGCSCLRHLEGGLPFFEVGGARVPPDLLCCCSFCFFFYRFVFAQGALLQLTRCLALDHASAVSSVAFEPAHTILDA